MLRLIIKNMGSYLKYAMLGPLLVFLAVICEMLMPRLMANIVDVGLAGGDSGYILRTGGLMAVLALAAVGLGVLDMLCSARASQGFAANLRKSLFSRVQDFSKNELDRFSTASLVTRLTTDVNVMQQTTTMGLRIMIRSPMMLIVALFMVISTNGQLALILLALVPMLLIIMAVLLKRGFPLFGIMQQKVDNLNRTVQENLIGMRVVKAFVRQDHEKEKFAGANEELINATFRAAAVMIAAMPLFQLLLNGATVSIIWLGGRLVGQSLMGTGALISFIGYIVQIMMSLLMFAMILMMVARSRASATRIREVLDARISIQDSKQTLRPRMTQGRVEFENVRFRYQENPDDSDMLKDVSFVAAPGQVVALIGSTGSGKSTLVSLIPRLADVSGGRVLIDGADVRDYALDELRGGIGMVLQQNTLFSGTIRENLRWGNEDAGDEQIEQAARNAQAHEFIMSFPDGYDTELGQGGVNLSGGQKQRLCIARAMLKQPKILILDDSTSAVDSATEARIRQSFAANLAGTTVFIIAQRISSVRNADQILILDDGEIVGSGLHDDLLETNRIYQEIYRSQQQSQEVAI